MSKTMPLGEKLAADIRAVADALGALADSIAGATPAKANAGEGNDEQEQEATPQAAQPTPITLEDVRAALTEKSRSGLTAQVKALLTKHGANKLSDIDPADYSALLLETEVLS
jgi:hypothetical protein